MAQLLMIAGPTVAASLWLGVGFLVAYEMFDMYRDFRSY